jgi:hypothetical protein
VADFDFGPAETDPQAEGLARRPRVVSALRDMPIAQRSDHLAFDDDQVLDNHGGEKNHASPLLDDAEPGLSHLVANGVPVDICNEPMVWRIGNPESTEGAPPGHRPDQPRIPFIHLHPAHPP